MSTIYFCGCGKIVRSNRKHHSEYICDDCFEKDFVHPVRDEFCGFAPVAGVAGGGMGKNGKFDTEEKPICGESLKYLAILTQKYLAQVP